MSKNTEQLIFIGAALIGAYAAWLTIKEKTQKKDDLNAWFTSGAFSGSAYDFYKG